MGLIFELIVGARVVTILVLSSDGQLQLVIAQVGAGAVIFDMDPSVCYCYLCDYEKPKLVIKRHIDYDAP